MACFGVVWLLIPPILGVVQRRDKSAIDSEEHNCIIGCSTEEDSFAQNRALLQIGARAYSTARIQSYDAPFFVLHRTLTAAAASFIFHGTSPAASPALVRLQNATAEALKRVTLSDWVPGAPLRSKPGLAGMVTPLTHQKSVVLVFFSSGNLVTRMLEAWPVVFASAQTLVPLSGCAHALGHA
ncbi:hypothetical protein NQ176_g9693 [Zarea fungicola]|uniref:Uncharacterized protein n=1 Tax=Zarea fungicola TaxID=93591 RepID=A0ACC1ML66_9HYPO|nr:hypothetical protein NQ176_g9693 [Lecanicillium fungicola]